MGRAVQLGVAPTEAQVGPGGWVYLALTICDAGDAAGRYRLDVEGIPGGIVGVC